MRESPINELAAAIDARAAADANLIRAVRAAHKAGHSWTEIAQTFGTSRQAVWERFARRIRDDG